MLTRILEPEVMDTADDAREYDSMDHAAVNEQFAADLLQFLEGKPLVQILDLGAGSALIPIELCRRAADVRVTAVDAATSMLDIARRNVAVWGLAGRISLVLADAKRLPFGDASFDVVISNSILHHIPEPRDVVEEAIRLTAPGGVLFHRDLCRPGDSAELDRIAGTYAASATPYQRKLFCDSLHAALTVGEMQQIVAEFGYPAETCTATSDRHWTWAAVRL